MHSTLSTLPFLALISLVSSTVLPRSEGVLTHHELSRRNSAPRNEEEVEAFALRQKAHVVNRYGGGSSVTSNTRRAVGTANFGDVGGDTEYFITLQVGTPPAAINFVADTGSADLWMATKPCISGCVAQTPLFDPKSSSSAKVSTNGFTIQYGSGDATGLLASDKISIGGLPSVTQIFGAVTNSNGVLSGNIAGICGLGFKALAETQATPILEYYAESGALDANEFGIALRRFNNITAAQNIVEPGGVLTIGGTNPSLYNGAINYITITDTPSYWLIPLQTVTVGGVDLKLPAASTAIDSGTSLIAAPQAACDAVYGAIPGAKPITFSGQQGYYSYPCSTQVKFAFTFGGVSYAMDPIDFNSGPISDRSSDSNLCLGALFVFDGGVGPSGPSWIIGDSFLKNVYSVYRFSPTPAVGFATLSNNFSSSTTSVASNSKSTSAATMNVGVVSKLAALVSIIGGLLLV